VADNQSGEHQGGISECPTGSARGGRPTSDMRRREFITLIGGAAAGWPLAARAQQQPANIARIGYLGFGTAAASAPRVEALRVALRELGYIEGKNIHIEFRWAERMLHELAGELARSSVDIIFADSSTEVEPARQATKTIPIVFATHADPVGFRSVVFQAGQDAHRISLPCEECPR
jgi:putative ABC transport system substrate-binding protein